MRIREPHIIVSLLYYFLNYFLTSLMYVCSAYFRLVKTMMHEASDRYDTSYRIGTTATPDVAPALNSLLCERSLVWKRSLVKG